MRFDWERFCKDHHVLFVTSGPNVAKGNINIKCPWCGDADESEHMGLSLDRHKPWYACWRNQMHRSRNPAILVAKLAGWPLKQAENFIENQQGNPDDFEAAMASLAAGTSLQERPRPKKMLEMPEEFRPFTADYPWSTVRRFLRYLYDRGIEQTLAVAKKYDLRWAVTGEYKNRIIIPVRHTDGTLANWTGRAIGQAIIRYRSLEDEDQVDGKKVRMTDMYSNYRNVKDCLLFHQNSLLNPAERILVVAEGPFDAIKLDYFLFNYGVTATCLFGSSISPAQLAALSRLGRLFGGIVVLLDAAARSESSIIVSQLEEVLGRGVKEGRLPSGVKDPGALPAAKAGELLRSLRRSA